MEKNITGMTYKIKEIAARIKELREITGLTVEEMAQRTGISIEEYKECISEDGTVSEKERRLLDKFAKNLGLNIESVHKLESIYTQSKKSNR